MAEITLGSSFEASTIVNETNTADVMGSGELAVFATPAMVALIEKAASTGLQTFLEPKQTSVGTKINVVHSMASPVGMEVKATATITLVDRRRVEFDVVVETPAGEIGRGTHTRFIADKTDFMNKTNNQLTK